MLKPLATLMTLVVGLGLAALLPAQPPGPDRGPLPKAKGKEQAKKKGEPGPRGDLTKAYNLLRRLHAQDNAAGRPEERIRDWTERASRYYRDGLKAFHDGDDFLAHEYGAIAHDLARASDHARSAALLDHRENDLPPPPAEPGGDDAAERDRRDLQRAYDRITEQEGSEPPTGSEFSWKVARDLYRAARRDLEAGREDRGGELARAAEAMTHVTEHLGHVAGGARGSRDRLGFRSRSRGRDEPPPSADDDGPKAKTKAKARRGAGRESELPPPLPR
jgi:hypothetical protein